MQTKGFDKIQKTMADLIIKSLLAMVYTNEIIIVETEFTNEETGKLSKVRSIRLKPIPTLNENNKSGPVAPGSESVN